MLNDFADLNGAEMTGKLPKNPKIYALIYAINDYTVKKPTAEDEHFDKSLPRTKCDFVSSSDTDEDSISDDETSDQAESSDDDTRIDVPTSGHE